MHAPKTVVHLFHDDADSVRTGARVAQRIAEVASERGVEVEVFCFGPAQRLLARPGVELADHLNAQIDALVADGVRVGACVSLARADGLEEDLLARGLVLAVARDEFIRFTLEGATVLTF
ncbi:MAG: DsrE family protein [Amnibacterium sp.]